MWGIVVIHLKDNPNTTRYNFSMPPKLTILHNHSSHLCRIGNFQITLNNYSKKL